jgi:hypothetical protein
MKADLQVLLPPLHTLVEGWPAQRLVRLKPGGGGSLGENGGEEGPSSMGVVELLARLSNTIFISISLEDAPLDASPSTPATSDQVNKMRFLPTVGRTFSRTMI